MANLNGTENDDTIYGTLDPDFIMGLAGNDTVLAAKGDDIVFGNQGNDVIYGGQGSDTVYGGQNEDLLLGNLGDDILLGNMGADVLYGGQGNDTLFGGQGDDYLSGDLGDDIIYGDLGFDVALYSGSVNDYRFGTDANGNRTVFNVNTGERDTLVSVEGIRFDDGRVIPVPGDTQVVTVPGPTVVVDDPDIRAFTFENLDPRFTTATGTFFFGDRTTPANGVGGATDPETGIFLGFAEQPRQADGNGGGKYRPADARVQDETLSLYYNVPAGSQSTANGSFANNPNRGAANFDLVVGTYNGSIADFINGGNRLELQIDRDNTAGTNYLTLNGVIGADGLLDWALADGTVVIGDNGGNANTAQNSEQQNFFTPNGVADLIPGANFQNNLTAYDAAGNILVRVEDHRNLVTPPLMPVNQ